MNNLKTNDRFESFIAKLPQDNNSGNSINLNAIILYSKIIETDDTIIHMVENGKSLEELFEAAKNMPIIIIEDNHIIYISSVEYIDGDNPYLKFRGTISYNYFFDSEINSYRFEIPLEGGIVVW